ncbi:MAG: hypothetical protein HGA71_07665 [Azonexaceae bacterium]|nr:hypothetical protein [Azonexaceae bacterium]
MMHATRSRRLYGTLFAALLWSGLAQAQSVERPDIQVGDRWKYETTDSLTKLVSSQTERIITAVSGNHIEGTENGNPARYTPDMNPVETPEFRFDPAASNLRFPLRPNDQWRHEARVLNKATGMTSHSKYEVTVVGREKVSVSSGTYDAYKLVQEGYSTLNPGITSGRTTAFTRTYWYAPSVKGIVKMSQVAGANRSEIELLETNIKP